MKKILIMGLPGSGKTTLASNLKKTLESKATVQWLNADVVRAEYCDWDFSEQGRIRQSIRMRDLSSQSLSDFVICDFVTPLIKMREIYEPDYLIWMDTITQGRYEDTNSIFESPGNYDLKINSWDSADWVSVIIQAITDKKWI